MKKFNINFVGLFCVTCLTCMLSVDTSAQYAVKRMPYPLNTKDFDEICPVMSFDEKLLYFTRAGSPDFNKTLFIDGEDISENVNSEAYGENLRTIYTLISGRYVDDPYTSTFNQDVWVAKLHGNNNPEIMHPGYPINDALPNSICSNFGNGNEYVVINQFEKVGGMQEGFSIVNRREDESFDFPVPFRIVGFNQSSTEVNLTMSVDKQHVLIAMEDAADSTKKDIYLSIKLLDTLYSEPQKITSICTPYNETTPFLSRDNSRLYFASDRPGGAGGLDIYWCDRLDFSYLKWSAPQQLRPTLNTEANESHPYVSSDLNNIYYTTDKDGSSDIYFARLIRPDHLDKPVKIILNISSENGMKGSAEISWGETYTGKPWDGFFRSKNGIYEYTFTKNEVFTFKAENRSYRSPEIIIDPQEILDRGQQTVFIDLVMTKDGVVKKRIEYKKEVEEKIIEPELSLNTAVGKITVLDNIYFIRSRPEVVQESYGTLRKLAKQLKARPTLMISVEGHTDNIGDKQSLKILSQSRAEYIKKFLINEGVKEQQVSTIGWGDEKPISDNSNERERKLNRRVEIRVLKEK